MQVGNRIVDYKGRTWRVLSVNTPDPSHPDQTLGDLKGFSLGNVANFDLQHLATLVMEIDEHGNRMAEAA